MTVYNILTFIQVTIVISPLLALMVHIHHYTIPASAHTHKPLEQPNRSSPSRLSQSSDNQQHRAPKRTRRRARRPQIRTSPHTPPIRNPRVLPDGPFPARAPARARATRTRSHRSRRSPLHLRMGPRLPALVSRTQLVQRRVPGRPRNLLYSNRHPTRA